MLVKTVRTPPLSPSSHIDLGGGRAAQVDNFLLPILCRYKWRLKQSFSCSYAVTSVRHGRKIRIIRMHRFIARTPDDMVCHHINHDALDNRASNLMNLTPFEHAKYFSYR